MTRAQRDAFILVIKELHDERGAEVFHHGDCLGADKTAHLLVERHAMTMKTHVYPCDIPAMRACVAGDIVDVPERPLVRNRRIVAACDILIATPGGPATLRSGTWATIRYGLQAKKPVIVIRPNGHCERLDKES